MIRRPPRSTLFPTRRSSDLFRIMGRIDDVLNVSGHRLGTMEIESALVANTKLVAEAAVVGRPDEMRSGEHTSELPSQSKILLRLLLLKKKKKNNKSQVVRHN